MSYRAPVNELLFALQTHGNLAEITQWYAESGLDEDTAAAIIEEAAKFSEEVFLPTGRTGDHGSARNRVCTQSRYCKTLCGVRTSGRPYAYILDFMQFFAH